MNLLLAQTWHKAAFFALVPLLTAFLPSTWAAQPDGRFSLSKAMYLAGEPVYLSFTVRNTSDQSIRIFTADPFSFCGGYQFDLVGARDRNAVPCGTGFGGSCPGSDVVLAPGESRIDRILLNARFDLRLPGSYLLHVTRRVSYSRAEEPRSALLKNFMDFQTEQKILIGAAKDDELRAEYAQYARELDSADEHMKLEAAQVIGYLAPTFMEPTILKMLKATSPVLQGYGVEGLRNLRIPSAHRALVEYIKNAPQADFSDPYQSALRYLGDIGDEGDIPLLIEEAHANIRDGTSPLLAFVSIGKVGGAAAVQALTAELNNPSTDVRHAAASTLDLTGSRAAVPVLIGLLQSPDSLVSITAAYGLEVLTHRSGATTIAMKSPVPDDYSKWMHWWEEHGQTATIFRADLCSQHMGLYPFEH